MKNEQNTAVLAVVAISTLAGCHAVSSGPAKPKSPVVNSAVTKLWNQEIQRVARSGDWILARSYSAMGDVVDVATTGESISHAMIYDAERNTVIEALSGGVRETPLKKLLQRNRYVMVVRPSGQDELARRQSVQRARAVIGAGYDFTGLVGLDMGSRFYCSELVAWASRLGDSEKIVTPSDLMSYGELVYFSGARDDGQVQTVATTRNGSALRFTANR